LAESEGKKGMQSINRFLSEKKVNLGIRISFENFERQGDCLIVPLCALSQLERLVSEEMPRT
jgi:hypothetical protein